MRRLRALLAAAAVSTGLACSDGGPPVPVEVDVRIVSPNGPEGAAVLEVATADLLQVSTSVGLVFSNPVAGTTRIVVIRDTPGTLGFTLLMNGGMDPPAIRLLEVVDGNDQPRPSLGGYRVEF